MKKNLEERKRAINRRASEVRRGGCRGGEEIYTYILNLWVRERKIEMSVRRLLGIGAAAASGHVAAKTSKPVEKDDSRDFL